MQFKTEMKKPQLKQDAKTALCSMLKTLGHESPYTTSNKLYSPNQEITFTGDYGSTTVTFDISDFEFMPQFSEGSLEILLK